MEKLHWTTEKRKVADLIPADYNPRRVSEKQRQDLMDSIKEFSEVEPVVANRNNTLIGGHQRVSIYADLGIAEIDVRVPDRQLTIEEEMRLNIRLNKNGGEWDPEKLKDMNIEMLLDVGFGDEELADYWDNVETNDDDFNPEKAVEVAKTTKIKHGDVFQMGDHRLMCGDSTKGDDVRTLLGDVTPTMIYCDPPYNIGLSYSKGMTTGGKYQGDYKDNKTEVGYKEFINATLANALDHAADNTHVFYWCDERFIWIIQTLFAANGVDNKRVCLWIKNNFNMTPQVAFNKAYEPCVYGTVGRPFLNKNHFNLNEVMNKEVTTGNQVIEEISDLFNIWLAKRDNAADYEHPTQKPITLHEKPLKRCTAPGADVLDLFGGSGSTLMACEQLKRKAYLLEQDPIFCQVIVNRWQDATGKKAEKIK